ncbi:hypothetical protein AB205_0108410 [Aquarana catesbeiana]|uniref:Uncharacterized protein n=1 Tax=Aquarana catesbeiana TaxID=8400 RepID=A0A2G9R6H2_AQUCT|nr:hypothetical protein AB205_0108410 [Aquarana catesbeiana]
MSPGKTGNSNESYYSGQSQSLLVWVACLFLCIGGAVWGTGRPGCMGHRSRCMGHRSRCIGHRSRCIDTRAAVGGAVCRGPHTTFCYGALLFVVTPLLNIYTKVHTYSMLQQSVNKRMLPHLISTAFQLNLPKAVA